MLVGNGFLGTSTDTNGGISYMVHDWNPSPLLYSGVFAKVFYDPDQAKVASLGSQTIAKGVNADGYYFVITALSRSTNAAT